MSGRWRDRSWLWPAIGSLLLLVFVFALSEELKFGIITANLAAASFLALVGIGQMFPIATGEGGIDLSIPFVMNFCAFLAVKMISGDPASIVLVLIAATAFGTIIGLINGAVVVQFRVPPIIGTLAVGFVVLTLVQIVSLGGSTTIANRAVTNFIRGSFLGIPTPAFVVFLIGCAVSILVNRTPYGRALLALGQNRRAAFLSGIAVNRTILLAYVISGVLAGLTGVLLAASVGSADLELGQSVSADKRWGGCARRQPDRRWHGLCRRHCVRGVAADVAGCRRYRRWASDRGQAHRERAGHNGCAGGGKRARTIAEALAPVHSIQAKDQGERWRTRVDHPSKDESRSSPEPPAASEERQWRLLVELGASVVAEDIDAAVEELGRESM